MAKTGEKDRKKDE